MRGQNYHHSIIGSQPREIRDRSPGRMTNHLRSTLQFKPERPVGKQFQNSRYLFAFCHPTNRIYTAARFRTALDLGPG